MTSAEFIHEERIRSCLVCSVPITSMHLGMDACRACSSFFKRARITGKEYPCRQGDRLCETDKDAKFVCRRCRFDKCIAVGLAYDGPMRERRKAKVPLLQRIKSEYKIFVERRRVQELIIVKSSGCHKRIPHPTEEIYNVHESTVYGIFNLHVSESFEFFRRAFPALNELSPQESEAIFKEFIGKLSIIESYYNTRRIWGGVYRYIMGSVVTSKDMERPMGGIDMNKFGDAALLESCARMHAYDLHEVLLPIFNRAKFDEIELYALLTIVMSELDISCGITEEGLVILDKYRQEALEGLQEYYQKELGLANYSTRIGNLMSVNHVVQECKSMFTVVLRFYDTLFDVYVANDTLKKLFL